MPIEPISLSISIVALASLFSTCVECFDLLDARRGFERDYELLIIQLQLEKTRLLDWSQSVGLLQTEGLQRPVDLDSPILRPVVEQALNAIRLLWTDSDQLISRYGLEESKSNQMSTTKKRRVGLLANSWFKDSWERFQVKTNANQRQTPLIKRARWALHDRAKFRTLVETLRSLVDALLAVTKSPDVVKRRQQLMRREIRSLRDTTVLSLLAENTYGIDRDWSEAASQALGTSSSDEKERLKVCNWLEAVSLDMEPIPLPNDQEPRVSMGLSPKVTVNWTITISRSELCMSLKAIKETPENDKMMMISSRTGLSDIVQEREMMIRSLKAFSPAIEQNYYDYARRAISATPGERSDPTKYALQYNYSQRLEIVDLNLTALSTK